jgi:hypothetical protein
MTSSGQLPVTNLQEDGFKLHFATFKPAWESYTIAKLSTLQRPKYSRVFAIDASLTRQPLLLEHVLPLTRSYEALQTFLYQLAPAV